jgi:hypothetical protein
MFEQGPEYFFDNVVLSIYERNILNKIIGGFKPENDFNLYELVQDAVSPNFVFPSQNGEILETFYDLRDYLLSKGIIHEIREMQTYRVTSNGTLLVQCGTIECYDAQVLYAHNRHLLN